MTSGLVSENTQKALLTKAKLTLDIALEISQGMEAATFKAKVLKASHRCNALLAVNCPPSVNTSPTQSCLCCGRGQHDPSSGIARFL